MSRRLVKRRQVRRRQVRGWLGSERGSGTVVALALGLGVVAVFMLVMPLYVALATRHSVAAAADAAALAAADTASGLEAGHPCEVAQRVASANRASVGRCTVEGLVVTVTATRSVLGFVISESATAGPAGSDMD